MTRQLLAFALRCITALQVAIDMAALFAAAKLQLLRQAIVRSIHNMR